MRQGDASEVRRWLLFAYPDRHRHDLRVPATDPWPPDQPFRRDDLDVPAELVWLLTKPARTLERIRIAAGLIWFGPAIRRIIDGHDRARLAALLGGPAMSHVYGDAGSSAVPGRLGAPDARPLLERGSSALAASGTVLLAGCVASYGNAWRHCLKMRLPPAEDVLVDRALALARPAAAERLRWFVAEVRPLAHALALPAPAPGLEQASLPAPERSPTTAASAIR